MKTKTWEINKLEEVCEILDNKRVPISSKNRIRGIYPYYGASGIVDYIDKYIFDEELVLIGEDGAKWGAFENSAFIAEGKYWVNNHAHILKPNNEILINKFLVYFLNYSNLEKYITGATVKKLNQQKLKQIEIPLPPLEEQMRIVKILDLAFEKIDTSVELLKANLANLDELAQSVLDRTFNPLGDSADSTESTQNPSTHDTQSPYPLPQHWEWKTLGEIGDIITGSTPSKNNPKFYGNDYPLFKPSDLGSGNTIKASDNLSKLGFESARKLPKNTLLVVCIGASIGKIGLSGIIGSCNQQINAIIPSPNVLSKYLFFVCHSKYFQSILKKNASQTTLPIINKTEFSKLEIPLPKDIKEQEQIAKHLDFVFEKTKALKELYTKELKDYEELKQSLLNKAFKGEL
ncbi:restriction endonuclease subunit S [Campylobacter coli]|nr:restriction endonuclease subunit S [Campylobacter coli]MCH3728930.1 restriction endonuclease subunit S [Campylobacter coli]HED0867655.1 restriction endonuclease subunit S [Campylobacter coli]HED0867703.1 restriction endonuclease subunit S [Campylobacter coli]